MPKDRESLRFLLIEARRDREMQEHELGCLARAGKLSPEQFDILDVLQTPVDPKVLNKYDAVFIGGTGDFSVARDRPDWYEPLVNLTGELLKQRIPAMGLCYGFHLMAAVAGGVVQRRPDLQETGTYDVTLTEEGRRDPILADLPGTFPAQQGHHDVVVELPEPFLCLASSQRCQWQAFRHPEAPFYGLQFHPELRREDFMDRMRAYPSYASTPEAYAEIDAQVKQTHNEVVIERFIDRVVLGGRQLAAGS